MADKQAQTLPPEGKKWLDMISAYERDFKKWEARVENIIKRYRDFDFAQDGRNSMTASFNILWSNIQVLMPATFARLPKPDVSRRFRDNDPVGRVAALLLERGLTYEVDHYPDYEATMTSSVLDRFLGGRGTAWVRYEPHIVGMPDEGLQITDDADESDVEQPEEEIEYECCPTDYVHWRDFGHSVARTWEEVTAVWRRVYMNKEGLEERFPDNYQDIPLDVRQKSDGTVMKVNDGSGDATMQACVYEIWDKSKSEVIWFNRTAGVIESKPDPLQLENFFPCPKPLYATLTTDTLIPVPDYKIYQDQAAQLNKLANRVDGLIDMLQVKGVYDAAVPELARLFKESGNGDLIAVKSWLAFAEKAGLKGSIDIFDITPIINALNECYTAIESVKNEIYELMGVSDIARGASDPTETYGAQKLKGSFGNMRLRSKQGEVVRFATDLLKIKAQIMCKHFQPQTILQIGAAKQLMPEDQALVPQALQLLMGERASNPEMDTKEGPLAGFRIEVSSDSLAQMDEQQEKGDRMEFLKGIGDYLQKALPVVQESPEIAPLLVGLLKFGVGGFKVGKTVEGMIDSALDQLTKQASQPQQPKPDPEMQKIQAESQVEQQKMQLQAQLDAQHLQMEEKLAQSQQAFQAQEENQRNQLEAQRSQLEAHLNAQLEAQKQDSAKEIANMNAQLQILLTHMKNANALEIAEIGAQTTIDAAQVSAAKAAEVQ